MTTHLSVPRFIGAMAGFMSAGIMAGFLLLCAYHVLFRSEASRDNRLTPVVMAPTSEAVK